MTHQASRAEHQGAEQAAPRCHIYNCVEESTHTVNLPASSAGRAAEVKLCPACHSDWRKHPDPERLRRSIDLVRARPPADGIEALLTDVIKVPRDEDAKRLVEAIKDEAAYEGHHDWVALAARLNQIGLKAERLGVLLTDRDAAHAGLVTALKRAVAAFEYQVEVCHARETAFQDRNISARPMDYQEVVANMYAATAEPLEQARAALARVKGGS